MSKRQRAAESTSTDEPSAKKKKNTGSSKKKVIEEATEADYAEINRILGFTLYYNHPTGCYSGHSGFTGTSLPYFAFPVLTRAPAGPGLKPEKLPSGDIGYFLGAPDPGVIFCALVEAYTKNRPNANKSVSPWKNWEPFIFNRCFYGADFEKSGGYQDIQVSKDEILNSREWGGRNHRLLPPYARTSTQKKYQKAVFLEDIFTDENLPAGLPKGGRFLSKDDLAVRRESYNQHLKQHAEIQLEKLSKKINSIAESDDSDEEEDEE